MDHMQACKYCAHHNEEPFKLWCSIYTDVSWVNRRGGCPSFPYRDLPTSLSYMDGKIVPIKKVGQQKQVHKDKTYHSKNDGRRKFSGKPD